MIKGINRQQITKILEFLKNIQKMGFIDWLDPDTFSVKDLYSQLNWSINVLKRGLQPLPDSDVLNSYADKTKAEYEISQLPDNFYKLKVGTTTVKIVLTSKCYDFDCKVWYNSPKHQVYSCKCIGWYPKIAKKLSIPRYDSQCVNLGTYKTLDECKQLFYMLCQEMLELNGFNVAKNMELFYKISD